MSHVRFVAVNAKDKFLVKPKGMHNWSGDLSKARLFKTEDAIQMCINEETTKESVRRKFSTIKKVECRLVKEKLDI